MLRKIANPAMESTHANPEAMRAMLGMPAATGAPAPRLEKSSRHCARAFCRRHECFAQVVEEAAPEAHPEQKLVGLQNLSRWARRPQPSQTIRRASSQLHRSASDASRCCDGCLHPGMQRAGGYGAGAAGLGLLGAGGYGPLKWVKESSAQPRTQLEAAFLQHMSKQAAAQQQPQQQQLSALDEEAIKVARHASQHRYAQEVWTPKLSRRRAIELLPAKRMGSEVIHFLGVFYCRHKEDRRCLMITLAC